LVCLQVRKGAISEKASTMSAPRKIPASMRDWSTGPD
jgi:hypothetical protein